MNETEETVDAAVAANRKAIVCWAMQHRRYVEALGSTDLREEVGRALWKATQKHKTPAEPESEG